MGLKNYTTTIKAQKTVSEIEELLVKNKATDTWKEYDTSGNVISLNFAVMTGFGKMPFKLKVNTEAVRQILIEQKKAGQISISKKDVLDIEYARNVGWRILKDLIDAQMAVVSIKMRKLEQVFLVDIWDNQSGRTFFEVLSERKFAGLIMEPQPPYKEVI